MYQVEDPVESPDPQAQEPPDPQKETPRPPTERPQLSADSPI